MAAPAHKVLAIDLGLSVLCAIAKRDDSLTCKDIAEVCDCTAQTISNIEHKALRKIRKSNHKINGYGEQ